MTHPNDQKDAVIHEAVDSIGPASTDNEQENCIFCKIARNELPTVQIYEDADTLAFLDRGPVHPGHALVVPKDHFENIYSTPAETWCRMALTVQKVALAVKEAVNADGVNIIMNNESAAGQEVFHAHIHIIPRHNDDGLRHWPHSTYKDQTEMENIGMKAREQINNG